MAIAHVKNWAEFQHYKDRSPPWIKLHRGLLDNLDYFLLSPEAAKCLPLLWLIASEGNGALPESARLAFRLRMPQPLVESVISDLTDHGFLVAGDAEQAATPAQPKRSDWPSRHVSSAVRIEVWNRDGGRCVCCGSVEKIEYDHKVPVSKGGESTAENLQLLCRTCNRRKRQRTSVPDGLDMRSLEGEGEGETERETEGEGVASATPPTRKKSPKRAEQTFTGWADSLGGDAIPPTDPVFAYAAKAGLPGDYVPLAWAWFEAEYGEDGPRAAKKYADWRAVFRKAVAGGWGKLWAVNRQGEFYLTTEGVQAQRALA